MSVTYTNIHTHTHTHTCTHTYTHTHTHSYAHEPQGKRFRGTLSGPGMHVMGLFDLISCLISGLGRPFATRSHSHGLTGRLTLIGHRLCVDFLRLSESVSAARASLGAANPTPPLMIAHSVWNGSKIVGFQGFIIIAIRPSTALHA